MTRNEHVHQVSLLGWLCLFLGGGGGRFLVVFPFFIDLVKGESCYLLNAFIKLVLSWVSKNLFGSNAFMKPVFCFFTPVTVPVKVPKLSNFSLEMAFWWMAFFIFCANKNGDEDYDYENIKS